MRSYAIKRGHFKKIDGRLKEIVEEVMGTSTVKKGKIKTSFGALKKIEIWIEGKTELWVDTEIDRVVDEKTAIETQKAYNQLLYRLTGFTAKERAKKLKEMAKKGEL